MTDDKKDEEIIKLKKKIEELENKPKNKFKKIYFFSVSTIILLLMILLLFLNFIYFGCALQCMGLVASRQVGSPTGDQIHVPCIGRWIS